MNDRLAELKKGAPQAVEIDTESNGTFNFRIYIYIFLI